MSAESELAGKIIELCKSESPDDIVLPMVACLVACGSMASWVQMDLNADQRNDLKAKLKLTLADVMEDSH